MYAPHLAIREKKMETITLDELYRKLKKNELEEGISLVCKDTRDKSKTKRLKIIDPLGKGAKGYVFRASNTKDSALKLSYQQDNYGDELETAMIEQAREYGKYYLNLQWADFRADSLSIQDGAGEKKLTLDADVYVSAWEVADHTLKDKIKANFDKKLEWFDQCFKGMRVIHARDRAHLDIKLANLFLIDDRVKIGDFDFYLKLEDFKRLPLDVCGTPGHIAPEMFYDKANITAQADIFSAGAAFARLFLGNKIPISPTRDEFIRFPGGKTDEDDVNMLSQSRRIEDVENQREFKQLKKLITEKEYNKWSERKQNLFKINYQLFYSLKKDLKNKFEEELNRLKPTAVRKRKSKELQIYQLLLKMMHIDPVQRFKMSNKTGIDKILQDFFIPGLLLGRKLLKRYRVQDIIDTGGKAIMYKVFDEFDREVKAIKLYPPKYNIEEQEVNEIRNEVKSTRSVNHDNIINVYHLEREKKPNALFIVMEYFNGQNLEKELNKEFHKKFPEEKALKIMKQVLAALIKAHEKSVFHNDLKPRNIMIDTDDNVKLLNFGWNRQLKHAVQQFTFDKQDFNNDLAYVPPEMYPDSLAKNINSDVWAFGVTLYRLLTGNLPYENQLQTKSIPEPAQPPPALSKEIWMILLKCLKTNKFQRYQNLEEIYRDLNLYEKNKQKSPTTTAETNEEQQTTETINQDDDSTSQSKNPESALILANPETPPAAGSPETLPPPRDKFFNPLKKIFPDSKSKRILLITSFVIIFLLLLAIPAELLIFKTGLLTSRQAPYQIWYTGAPGPWGTTAQGIGCASSTDGHRWNHYSKNPIITANKTNQFKNHQPAYPYIVHHNNTYHMLCKLEKQDGESNRCEIGYASSKNGIHWDFPGYNPVTLDNNNITSPGPIIYQKGQFHMWYAREGDIYYAHTDPGDDFILKLKKHGNTPVLTKGTPGQWDDQALEPGTVIFDTQDNLFKMWYTGKSKNANQIGYATSTDGIQWYKHPGNPVYDDDMFKMEMYPAVVKVPGGFNMYYTAASQTSDYYPIRLATSSNGIKWKKYSNRPVISGGQEKNKIFITAVKYNGGK